MISYLPCLSRNSGGDGAAHGHVGGTAAAGGAPAGGAPDVAAAADASSAHGDGHVDSAADRDGHVGPTPEEVASAENAANNAF